ncbi:MAG TPA: hypothetical protein VMU43_00470 [Candidatus Acidoferrum sp.]|nr:hypothetical protein [Candidatus Acidoferrum sp.]
MSRSHPVKSTSALHARTAVPFAACLITAAVVFGALGIARGAVATPQSAASAATLPHDSHDDMSISAEPFADAEAAKQKFGKANPQKAGILAVNVVFHNTASHPVKVNLDSIELEVQDSTGQRQSLDPMDLVQVAETIAYPGGMKEPSVRRFPLGIIGSSSDKKVQKVVDDLKPFTLNGDVIGPGSKLEGCLYFNLAHEMNLAQTADLYIPDLVTLPDKKPLLFFDIPFGSGAVEP